MSNEIASAYIALYAKMPGVKNDIEKSLGGSDVQGAADSSGRSLGGKLLGGLSAVVKTGAIAVGATMAAGLGVALVKGFSRLQAIDNAEKKLIGLGNTSENVAAIMDNARNAVTGTAFGLGDAATVSASLVAANIKPGEDLEKVLKSVANSAAAAGTDLGEMGSIYAKVASIGKAQNDVLMQVADRGVPIYQKLAEQLGITEDEVFSMASAGKIGFAEFEQAMSSAAGTVAEEMAKTLPGATENFFARLGRIGAEMLSGVYPYLAPLVSAVTSALGPLEEKAAEVGAKIGEKLGPGLQWLTDTLNAGINLSGFFELLSVLSPIGMAFRLLEPVLPLLMDSFAQIGQVLGGAVATVFAALIPIVTQLATVIASTLADVLPVIMPLFEQLAGVISDVLVAIMPLVAEIAGVLGPVFALLIPIIAAVVPIIGQLLGALMPIVQAVLPVLSTLLTALAPIFTMLLSAILPILEPILALVAPLLELVMVILQPLLDLLSILITVALKGLEIGLAAVIPFITGVVDAINSYLVPIIETITSVLEGVVTFLTGVFTGNWEMAWQGIQDIFDSIWQGMIDITKGAINFIIDLINGVIGAFAGFSEGISDLTGGAFSVSFEKIPKLADGGVISRRPGGIIANIGEGRYDEAVGPLSPGVLSQLGGGSKTEISMPIYAAPGMDAETVGQTASRRLAWELRSA